MQMKSELGIVLVDNNDGSSNCEHHISSLGAAF
jgi:GTP cyclohydrolase I